MVRIGWCMKQRRGIELVEPNDNLAEGYLSKAEDALETSALAKSVDWKVSASYYALYFSVYSLMMRLGIRCEIHKCTIELARFLLAGHLDDENLELLEDAFRARNDLQYYVDRSVPDITTDKIIKGAPEFMAVCRSIVFDENTVKGKRDMVKELD